MLYSVAKRKGESDMMNWWFLGAWRKFLTGKIGTEKRESFFRFIKWYQVSSSSHRHERQPSLVLRYSPSHLHNYI